MAEASPTSAAQPSRESSGADSSAIKSPGTPRKRPWWRLHFSTWCLVFLALAVLLLANIPGSYDYFTDRWSVKNGFRVHHGWPWTMLERKFGFHDYQEDIASLLWRWDVYVPEKEAAFADEDSWSPTRRMFHPAAIAGNVAVALGILVAVAFLAEWRRRRRNRFWQVTLTEGVIASTVLAGFFALLGWAINDTQRQQAALEAVQAKLPPDRFSAEWKSYLPDWWETLSDKPFAGKPLLGRVDFISLQSTPPDIVLEQLRHMPGVTELWIGGVPLKDRSLVSELRHLRQLRLLQLPATGIRNEDLVYVAACETLVELDVSWNPISDEGLRHLYQLQRLEALRLNSVNLSEEAVDALQAALPQTDVNY